MKERPASSGGTIVSLQYLRAIAALLVVYFHSALQASGHGLTGPSRLPIFGASGVDIFFVLSGYVMWLTTSGRRTSPADFLRRRIIRIVPLYWVVTLTAATVALLLPELLRSTRFDLAHLLGSLSFIPYPNPAAGPSSTEIFTPVVVPGWTLNMEMFFYVLFAVVLPLSVSGRIIGLALLLVLAFLIASFAPASSPVSFYASTIMFEFWFGVALAAALDRSGRPSARRTAGSAPMLLMVWSVAMGALVLGDLADWPGPRCIVLGVPALLIVASAIVAERLHLVPRVHWLEELGNSSYSLYLTHGFVVAALRVLFARTPLLATAEHPAIFLACALGGSVVVALITYRWVEQPLVRLTGRFLAGPRRPAVART